MKINVNLKPCTTAYSCRGGHHPLCPGEPVLIPCPLPRSVTFTVRLGECPTHPHDGGACEPLGGHWEASPLQCVYGEHEARRPIRVSCTIGGDGTWKGSEVGDIEPIDFDPMKWSWAEGTRVGDACRERWALVKALVLNDTEYQRHHPELADLFAQRDAVYGAIADIARAESTIIQRLADIDRAYTNRARQPFRSIAADELAAYVRQLPAAVTGS